VAQALFGKGGGPATCFIQKGHSVRKQPLPDVAKVG
jgi:hypothetical protein